MSGDRANDDKANNVDTANKANADETPSAAPETPSDGQTKISRRGLLLGAGALGAGAVGGFAFSQARGDTAGASEATPHDTTVAFTGTHQAGIVTPAQDRLYFAAFDVITDDRDELAQLMADWTAAAARMTAGLEATETGAVGGAYLAPPEDTGEALGLPASGLTLTFGFGPSLFTTPDGTDRFGLADRQPAALITLPHFPGDRLAVATSGGDFCVQACANDPQVAFHAVRNLARIGFGVVALRWTQLGFGRTSSTSTTQATARNLFGFKDGTANIKAEDDDVDEHVWVQPDDVGTSDDWMVGGSYLVARRIAMHIETWDRTSLSEQEQIVGRTKGSGAPLSGGEEFTEPDFTLEGRDGPLVAPISHVALAHPDNNDGVRMLRRGYNFTDGSTELGRLDAGLFFLAYVRDIGRQFVPIQLKLSRSDAMMEYLVTTGSATFAVPPGTPDAATPIGAALFA